MGGSKHGPAIALMAAQSGLSFGAMIKARTRHCPYGGGNMIVFFEIMVPNNLRIGKCVRICVVLLVLL